MLMNWITSENVNFDMEVGFVFVFLNLTWLDQIHNFKQNEAIAIFFHSSGLCTIFASASAAAQFSSREAPSRVKAHGMKCIKGAFVDKKSAGKRRGEE